jgi:hypothetical protein
VLARAALEAPPAASWWSQQPRRLSDLHGETEPAAMLERLGLPPELRG